MVAVLAQAGLAWPVPTEAPMADLLHADAARDPESAPAEGQRVLGRKGCLKGHRRRDEGGAVGPELVRSGRPYASAAAWAAAMWRHAPGMAARAVQMGGLYSRFTGHEVRRLASVLGQAAAPSERKQEERTMRWMTTAGMLGAAVAAVILGSAGPGAAQAMKIPPDFVFEQGKESPGPVTFSHEKHKAKVEKCTACHVKVFKMKKGQSGALTMAKMKAGEQCGACHDGKTRVGTAVVFSVAEEANCAKCHKK